MTFLEKLFYTTTPPLRRSNPAPASAKSKIASVLSAVFGGRVGSGIFSDFTFREATEKGFRSQVWVYRCITELGQAVGSIPWKVVYVEDSGVKVPLSRHPLEKLLNNPNPNQDRSEFFATWIAHLSLAGNAYWEKTFVVDRITGTSRPVVKTLYHVRPDWIAPIPDPVSFIKGYEFRTRDGKMEKLKPFEITHFRYVDPMNPYVGVSPMSAAARTIEIEDAAVRWNKAILDNYAVPGGILNVPGQGVVAEERKEIQEEIEREFTGENRHRPMILWGGMTWEQLSLSPKDMEFLEQRKINKYEICSILGVPPQIIGANEDPTYSNYSVARLSFWEDTIIPLLDWLQTKINGHLAIYWGENIRAEYDISNVPAFRDSFAQLVTTAKTLFDMSYPINLVNKRLGLGLEDVPWGNVAWMPLNLVPVSTSEAPPTPPEESPVPENDDVEIEDTLNPDDEDVESDEGSEEPTVSEEAGKKQKPRPYSIL